MKKSIPMICLAAGVIIGAAVSQLWFAPAQPMLAGDSRYEDFIMTTGEVLVSPNRQKTEGVWVLDYQSGKLLGTVIDRNIGKIIGWAEVDLLTEFGVKPRQNVHFMMTTGSIANGQSALYLAETSTGKLGVYTLGQRPDGQSFAIRRHDLVFFRQPQQAAN